MEQPHQHALKVIQQVMLFPSADKFQPFVSRPRIARQFEDALGNILETAVLEPSLPTHRVIDGRSEIIAGGHEIVGHGLEIGIGGDGVVVALEDACYAVEFGPASWFEVPGMVC